MSRRPFIGIFGVFLILGCLTFLREQPSARLEKKAEGKIEGVVFDIAEKANTTQLHLRNCAFYEEAGKEPYPVGTILIYYSKKSNQAVSGKRLREQSVQIGNKIKVTGSLEHFCLPRNPGQFNEWIYNRSRGYQYKFFGEEIEVLEPSVWKASEMLRGLRQKFSKVYDENLDEEKAGVVKAMVLGEKSGLSDEIKRLYRQNGIGHLMAISGLHISLLGMGFYEALKKLGSPKKLSCLLAILFIWLYGMMTGFGISTNRAVVMLMLSFIAGMVGRTYDMATALCLSGSLILMEKPMLCMDGGFLMSFGSVVGIGFFYPLLEKVAERKNQEKEKGEKEQSRKKSEKKGKMESPFLKAAADFAARGFLASFSVQSAMLPIILYFYYEMPLYGVILNLLVLPLMSILLGLGLLGGAAGILLSRLPLVSRFFLGGVHVILDFYEKSGQLFQALPHSTVIMGRPKIWQIILYYIALAAIGIVLYATAYEERVWGKVFWLGAKRGTRSLHEETESLENSFWVRWKKLSGKAKLAVCLAVMSAMVMLLVPVERWAAKDLEITFLDVGQGDCIFLRGETGMTCLIDGGSTDEGKVGAYRIIPFLKAKGVGSLDYVMVTHGDSDHMNGILELLEEEGEGGIAIKNLVLPQTTLIEENYEKLIEAARDNGIPVIYIRAGDQILCGDLKLSCLHPLASFVPENTNSYSMVLKLEYRGFKALFTGDLEGAGEESVLGGGELTDIFLLKVAHHGSKNSTGEDFLRRTKPEISIISCGRDNSYGHPHEELLERLEEAKSQICQTRDSGAVTVRTDGVRVWIEKYLDH